MKKIGLLLLLIFNLSIIISAQEKVKEFDQNEYVYWFYLRAEKKIDKVFNRFVYSVRPLSKTPKYGTYAKYSEDTWRCLQGGQQLVIGPFKVLNDAKQSIAIYELAKLSPDILEREKTKLRDSSEMAEGFCYFLKFEKSKRTNNFRLIRIPARTNVEPISIDGFLDQFLEGLTMEMLTIGPFSDRREAEISKRLNRLEEK